ncbi:MAG: AAA family ATPase [Candidatus Aenigmatarchaeota archaeon]
MKREQVKKQKKQELREISAFDRPKTKHEQFLSFAFQILQSDEVSIYTKKRTIEILKNIPDDAFEDTQQRAILDILRASSEWALTDKEKFLDYAVVQGPLEKYDQGKLRPHIIAHIYYMEAVPFYELFKRIGLEIVDDWKKKKKQALMDILKNREIGYNELLWLSQEVAKIEQFNLIEENTVELAQERFLAKAAKPEDFDYQFEWLYPDFIAKGTINLFVAPPSQGKSALALALGLHLLEKGAIEKLLYFDADNPVSVHVQRRIHELVQKYQGKLFYFKGREIETAQKFQKLFLESSVVQGKILVIIDTLRAFVGPCDINKGEVAENIMALFRRYLLDGEKTIIILHHVNKALAQDERNLRDRVKGATEFLDRADVAYYIEKKDDNKDEITISLTNIKPRIPTKSKFGFKINFANWSLVEEAEPLSTEEKQFIQAVHEAIKNFEQMKGRSPNKYQLVNELTAKGWGRNQSVRLLEKFERKFWYVSYDSLFNQLVYKIKNGTRGEVGEVGEVGELGNLEMTRLSEMWGDSPQYNNNGSKKGGEVGEPGEVGEVGKSGMTRLSGEARINSDFPSSPGSPVFHSTLYQNYQNEKGGEVGKLGNLDQSKLSGETLDSSDFPSSPLTLKNDETSETLASSDFPSSPGSPPSEDDLDELIENTYIEDAKEQFLRETIQEYIDEYYRRNRQYPILDQVLAWCFWKGIKKEETHMYLTFSPHFKLTPDKLRPHLIVVHPADIIPEPLQKFTDISALKAHNEQTEQEINRIPEQTLRQSKVMSCLAER